MAEYGFENGLESSGCRLVAVISENLTGRAKKGHKKV
jgi:hypothetical protein